MLSIRSSRSFGCLRRDDGGRHDLEHGRIDAPQDVLSHRVEDSTNSVRGFFLLHGDGRVDLEELAIADRLSDAVRLDHHWCRKGRPIVSQTLLISSPAFSFSQGWR